MGKRSLFRNSVTWVQRSLHNALGPTGDLCRIDTFDGARMKPTGHPTGETESATLTKLIQDLGDWRGATLAHVRKLIKEADPAIIEEIKWRRPSNPAGVPVWSDNGIVCTGEAHKAHVRLTFAKGASIKDPEGIFNSGLAGGTLRAIVLHEGEKINEAAFKDLFRSAVAANATARADRSARKK